MLLYFIPDDIIRPGTLQKALTEKWIGGAGLDVTQPEPLPRDHPLLHMDNVLVMPHWGSATHSTRVRMYQDAAANLRAVIKQGESPVYEASE